MNKITKILILCLIFVESNSEIENRKSWISPSDLCGHLPYLSVLPGRGFDILTHKNMGEIFEVTYAKCTTTDDGRHLIPDQTYAIPVKESRMTFSSEYIDNWSNYKSVDSESFDVSADGSIFGVSLKGSFSSTYQEMKQHQVDEKASTLRTSVRDTRYTIALEPMSKLHPGFVKMSLDIMKEIEINFTLMAKYLSQMLIGQYGTHYQYQLSAGAILFKDDYVTKKFLQDNEDNLSFIKAQATADFFGEFSTTLGYSHNHSESKETGYKNHKTSSQVFALGGAPLILNPENSTYKWIYTIEDNLVTVDRSARPLFYLYTEENFPGVKLSMLAKIGQFVKDAIDTCYKYNAHKGCTDPESPNFDYSANVDNKNCQSPTNNYTFGGVYRVCTNGPTAAGNLCWNSKVQKNPLTGDFSCKPGYTSMLLVEKQIENWSEECKWWGKCWDHYSSSTMSTFWCYKHDHVANNTGAMYGGSYTPKINNPLTMSKSCPPTYFDILATDDLHICVGFDFELGYKYSAPFGGFFSCKNGNPLYDIKYEEESRKYLKLEDSAPVQYPQACPDGFTQHTASVIDSCIVAYCLKANTLATHSFTRVRLPPFISFEQLFNSTQDYQNLEEPSSSQESTGSGWEITSFVLIGFLALIVLSLLIMMVLRNKRQSSGRIPLAEFQEREPLVVNNDEINEGNYQNL